MFSQFPKNENPLLKPLLFIVEKRNVFLTVCTLESCLKFRNVYGLFCAPSGRSCENLNFPTYLISRKLFFFEIWNCSQFKYVPQYFLFLLNKMNFCCGHYSRKYGNCDDKLYRIGSHQSWKTWSWQIWDGLEKLD